MTRNEFLTALRNGLSALNEEERDAAVRYYEEFLCDAEDENEAIRQLGSPKTLADRILVENGVIAPIPTYSGAGAAKVEKSPFYKSVWFWICMVLCLPIILPLGVGALGLALGLAGALLGLVLALGGIVLAIVLSFVAIVLSLGVLGIYFIAHSFTLFAAGAEAVMTLLGIGLCMLSAAVLIGLGVSVAFSAILKASKKKKGAESAQAQTAAATGEKRDRASGAPMYYPVPAAAAAQDAIVTADAIPSDTPAADTAKEEEIHE